MFDCIKCDFHTCKKQDYKRHLGTIKHTSNTLATTDKHEKTYFCKHCQKCFHDRSGLWRHKKKCVEVGAICSDVAVSSKLDTEMLLNFLMKENSEFKQLLVSQTKQMVDLSNHVSFNTTNSHNKTFNLQIFLNETCKDAMNIMEFVESLNLQLSDLENVGKYGFVDGISNIIIKNLNLLDETKRPIHCTDTKREVMYVKDDDKWEKDNEDNKKLRKAVKHIAQKNSKMLKEFKQQHPDCDRSESKYSDKYNMLIIEAMGGRGDNDSDKENKIIRNISKNVAIEK